MTVTERTLEQDTMTEQRPNASETTEPSATTDSAATTDSPTTTGAAEPRPSKRAMFVGIFLDAGLAVITYLVLHLGGASDFVALLAAAVVASLRAVYVIIRRREVDGFAVYMIFIFALGLALSFVTGSARFLLIKDSIGSTASGLAFLGTCLVGKPLMYYAAQRFSAPTKTEREEWNALWPVSPGFRAMFRTMSVVWGIAFLVEAALRLLLIFTLPIPVVAVISPIMTPVMITGLVIWSARYGARGEARLTGEA